MDSTPSIFNDAAQAIIQLWMAVLSLMWEIILAFIFALIVVLVGFDRFSEKYIKAPVYRRTQRIRATLDRSVQWVQARILNEKTISRRAIENAIMVQIDAFPREIIVNAIHQHGALRKSQKYAYKIESRVFNRRFAVKRLMSLPTVDAALSTACHHLGVLLNSKDIDLVVCPGKSAATNEIVAKEIMRSFSRQCDFFAARYLGQGRFRFTDKEAVEGKNVVVVDTVVCADEPLHSLVNYLRQEGATIKKVGALFDARGARGPIESGRSIEITSAFLLNLDETRSDSHVKVRRLNYDDY